MRRVLEGTIMKDREFDDDEIDYLRSLPAVNSVGRNRIRYTDQFREYCMQRYRAGDSPTGIFRDVGLDPSLIGYKRIERCIARWKMMEPADDDAEPISADKFPRTGNPLIPPAPIRAATTNYPPAAPTRSLALRGKTPPRRPPRSMRNRRPQHPNPPRSPPAPPSPGRMSRPRSLRPSSSGHG